MLPYSVISTLTLKRFSYITHFIQIPVLFFLSRTQRNTFITDYFQLNLIWLYYLILRYEWIYLVLQIDNKINIFLVTLRLMIRRLTVWLAIFPSRYQKSFKFLHQIYFYVPKTENRRNLNKKFLDLFYFWYDYENEIRLYS